MVTLVRKPRAQTVPFGEIVFPAGIHDFLPWKDFILSYRDTAEFLQMHLAGNRP